MSGRRAQCPNCSYRGKGRGLYSRPKGSYRRLPGLHECSQCGTIFHALDKPNSYGHTKSLELIPADQPPQAFLEHYEDHPDAITDDLVEQIAELYSDTAAETLDNYRTQEDQDDA